MGEPYPDKELLQAKEVAKMLSMDGSAFRKLLKESGVKFPKPVKVGAKATRWRKREVQAFIDLLGS